MPSPSTPASRPAVSVIIPNYNHAKYLDRRIRSVLDQSYQDFEVIILDDASTDNSQDILKSYVGTPKVRLLFNEQNSGSVFCQWNRGVREARGEYVWIAESDDYADSRFLERLVGVMNARQNVGLAYCDSNVVDESGQFLKHSSQWSESVFNKGCGAERWRRDFMSSGAAECAQFLAVYNTISNASAVIFRKSVYEQAGYAREDMKYAGDWMQWARMLLISDVAYVSEPLNYFRRHLNSVGQRHGRTYLDLKECLMVSGFVEKSVRLPAETRRRIRQRYSDWWRELGAFPGNRVISRGRWECFRLALRLDVGILGRTTIDRIRHVIYHHQAFAPIRWGLALRRKMRLCFTNRN